jgi:hypothetical protein
MIATDEHCFDPIRDGPINKVRDTRLIIKKSWPSSRRPINQQWRLYSPLQHDLVRGVPRSILQPLPCVCVRLKKLWGRIIGALFVFEGRRRIREGAKTSAVTQSSNPQLDGEHSKKNGA